MTYGSKFLLYQSQYFPFYSAGMLGIHQLYNSSLNRQQEKLEKQINIPGYQEKVPARIQEENVAKLAKILQELDFFDQESTRLGVETK